MPDLPGPKKAKAFPVPSDHGLGLDDDECGAPAGHTPHSQAQRSRSSGINFGFFTERCRTPSWCRSARFSNWRFTRVLKPDDRATTSVVSISSVRARTLWSLRKPHLLRSFDIYGREADNVPHLFHELRVLREFGVLDAVRLESASRHRAKCTTITRAPSTSMLCGSWLWSWAGAKPRSAPSTGTWERRAP